MANYLESDNYSINHGKSETGGKRKIDINNGRNPIRHLASTFLPPVSTLSVN